MSRYGFLLPLALLLLALAAWAQEEAVAAQDGARPFTRPMARALPPELGRLSLLGALGNRALFSADCTYIECLQYIGDARNRNDARYAKALPLYGSLQWLDPGFSYAIKEGISFLGWVVDRPREAESLAKRAMEADPKYTRYSAYWAALAYQGRLDNSGVVEALRAEAMRPDASEMLLRILGHIYIKEKDWKGALTYWRWIKGRKQNREYMTREWARRSIARAERELAKQRGR